MSAASGIGDGGPGLAGVDDVKDPEIRAQLNVLNELVNRLNLDTHRNSDTLDYLASRALDGPSRRAGGGGRRDNVLFGSPLDLDIESLIKQGW